MHFRKRLSVIPGVQINCSDSGFSATIGSRGLSVNMGKHGAFLNAGIPGSGIYHRENIAGHKKNKPGFLRSFAKLLRIRIN
jgi:hypothetical protein